MIPFLTCDFGAEFVIVVSTINGNSIDVACFKSKRPMYSFNPLCVPCCIPIVYSGYLMHRQRNVKNIASLSLDSELDFWKNTFPSSSHCGWIVTLGAEKNRREF